MPQIKLVDIAIQQGRGAAAQVLGQSYDIYRLSGSTSGGIIGGSPTFSAFKASIRKSTDRKAIENTAFELQIFEATVDNRNLNLGDVLVENPAYYGGTGSAYILAQKRPLRETLLVRAEFNISVTRPNPLGGQAGQQPSSGIVAVPPATQYGGVMKSSELLCTLTTGLYAFSTSGTLASIPCGLQPQNRIRSPHKPDFPTQVSDTRFCAYLPLLPGVQVVENDILNLPNGDRYMVIEPYSSGNVGLTGWILLVQKMAV